VFVLGGPGAGKGTQCANLQKEFPDVVHLSAGDLLRRERQSGSKNGNMIDEYIKEGKIVPVEVTVGLLKKEMEAEIKKNHRIFIVDGFPRNEDNVTGWDKVMGSFADVRFVLYLDLPEEVMEKRILKRGETSGRTDDNIESIQKRFKTFRNESYPIIQHYEKQGKVRKLEAVGDVDKIYHKVRGTFASEFSVLLVCPTCGATQAAPKHCRQEMHIEDVNGTKSLVCWMGPKCGVKPLPSHCGNPMVLKLLPAGTKPTSSTPATEGSHGTGGGPAGVSPDELKKRQAQLDALDKNLEDKHHQHQHQHKMSSVENGFGLKSIYPTRSYSSTPLYAAVGIGAVLTLNRKYHQRAFPLRSISRGLMGASKGSVVALTTISLLASSLAVLPK